MQGPVSGTVLCIREIGAPYVILNSFPCGKKSRPLSIIVHKDTISPPVQQDRLSLRIIQSFSVLAEKEFVLNWLSVFLWKRVGGFFAQVWMRAERSQSPIRPATGSEKGTADQKEALAGKLTGLFCFCFVLRPWNTRRARVEWFYGSWLTGSATASN